MINKNYQLEDERLLSLGFVSIAAMYASIYLEGGVCPGGIVLAWLGVTFLAAWGLGWSVRNLSKYPQLAGANKKSRRNEIVFWLVIMLAILAVSSWKLGGLALNLLPSLVLFSAAIGMLRYTGMVTGVIQGLGMGLPALLGWTTVHQSLFTNGDSGAWLLFSFIVLWAMGNEILQRGLTQSQDGENDALDKTSQGWARIISLLSLVPLFFIGHLEEMGVLYGVGLFIIFLVSEVQFRRRRASKDLPATSNVNYFVALILLAMIIYGKII